VVRTLNIGSGKDFKEDCLNADIQESKKPDWVLDITKVPWGKTISTRFGEIKVEKGMFSKIIANDVLEHITDLIPAMENCRDLLDDKGEFHISVPYYLSLGAWQDPTHVRAFNENSWLYYCEWHWYLNWEERFWTKLIEFRLSNLAKEMDINLATALMMPKMIDHIAVILTKYPSETETRFV